MFQPSPRSLHIVVDDFHIAFSWLGFVVPCFIATLYLVWRRDGLTRQDWLIWGVATVATFFFTTGMVNRGIVIFPLYLIALVVFYAVPAMFRRDGKTGLPAGTVAALMFFSLALVDLVAVLVYTPDGRYPVVGGARLRDTLVRSPLQTAMVWFCFQCLMVTRVKRPHGIVHPPMRTLLGFHFSLRPSPRPEAMRA